MGAQRIFRVTIALGNHRVTIDDAELELTRQEFSLLKVLCSDPGQVIPSVRLLYLAWGDDFVGDDSTVKVHVYQLRKKFLQRCPGVKFISTIPRVGYRWEVSPFGAAEVIVRETDCEPLCVAIPSIEIVSGSLPQSQASDTERPVVTPSIVGLRFADSTFRGRCQELEDLRRLLLDDGVKLISIVGLPLTGKTAILSHLCSEVERGFLGQDGTARPFRIDGILYISCEAGPLTALRVFDGLGQMLNCSQGLGDYRADGTQPAVDKVTFLLEKMQLGRYLLVLYNFENTLSEDGEIEDPALQGFLKMTLSVRNSLKVLLTCSNRVIVERPGRQVLLQGGLTSDDAVGLLRDLDPDGELGLRDGSAEQLDKLADICKGIPYSLKMAARILATGMDLCELFENQEMLTDFSAQYGRLSVPQRQVLEALAVWNQPVTPEAVSYLLPGVDNMVRILHSLVRSFFVSNQKGFYKNSFGRDDFYQGIPDPIKRALHQRQIDFMGEEARSIRRGLSQRRNNPLPDLEVRSARLLFLKHEALYLAERLGDELSKGRAYLQCADTLIFFQEFTLALSMAKEACLQAELAGDYFTVAKCLHMRASMESTENEEFGDFHLIDRAIALAKNNGDLVLQEALQRGRVQLCLRREEWLTGVDEGLEQLSALRDVIGEETDCGEFLIWQMTGESLALRNRWEEALKYFQRVTVASTEAKHTHGQCASTGWLGLAQCHLGMMEAGLANVREALRIERDVLGSREGAAKWLHFLGEMFERRGEDERALSAMWLSEGLREELRHSDLIRTRAKLRALESRLGVDLVRLKEETFEPRLSEFSEYAFLWGLGRFRKHLENPILTSQGEGWESAYVYNAAAWTDGNEVSLFYRAEGPSTLTHNRLISSIGLAVSQDGIHFHRHPEAVLVASGDEAYGGCEDPRVVKIDDLFYMTYTSFDGKIARLAMATSPDRVHWKKHGYIFSDAQWDGYFTDYAWGRLHRPPDCRKPKRGWCKAGALLAQPVQDKYWMYFGDNHIWAAWSRDLVRWEIVPEPVLSPRIDTKHPGSQDYFDSYLVESGPPPLLMKDGIWLGYNGACIDMTPDCVGRKIPLRYSFGQALFAKDDPTRVIRRSTKPLLEPATVEEIHGQVPKVIFAEGLVSFRGEQLLYYGMADAAIGVAIATESF